MIPIWSDTYYTQTNLSKPYLNFTIETDDEPIFNGKAWLKPNAVGITINLNQYCKDYLRMDMMDLLGVTGTTIYTHLDAVKEFVLKNENNVVLGTFTFVNDWSYEYKNYNNKPYVLSKPINGKAINGMMLFGTYLDSDNKVKTIISYSTIDVNNGTRTNLYNNTNIGCKPRYALYYLNRSGGWDSFLIEGKTVKKDTYQNHYTENNYNNNTTQFGKKVYHSTISTTYQLHTSWLNDKQSDNLAFNLLSSNMVYLHDLEDNTIKPVVIINTETDYKTFRNNGNKLCSYTINVECSQKQYNL